VLVVGGDAERARVRLRGGEVVHPPPGQDRRQDDERDEHEARALQLDAGGADDHQRHRELHRGRADVAARGVEAQRAALLLLRVEEGDVRHRGGEVAAAEAGEGGDAEEHAEGEVRVLHGPGQAQRGEQEQERGDDGPVPAAEDRDGERVGDPQRGAHQDRQGDEPEHLVHGEVEAGGAQLRHHDRPQGPHGEAEELREDREDQVPVGDAAAGTGPLLRVLGVPVVDPAAAADVEGGGGGGCRRCGGAG